VRTEKSDASRRHYHRRRYVHIGDDPMPSFMFAGRRMRITRGRRGCSFGSVGVERHGVAGEVQRTCQAVYSTVVVEVRLLEQLLLAISGDWLSGGPGDGERRPRCAR
jgi:hypothetical protein